ncbi:hypothetical protein K1719_012693 [Acacia pycnantha]|nr:hypothetical protein K1719_012693 [Acacia pycnantha]
MEIQIPYSILFTFLCLLILVLKPSRLFKKSKKTLPPGPWKLPIIGNLHQMLSSSSPLHHTMRDLAKKYGPLFHLQLGETSNIIVSSTEVAKEVMKTHDITFANRPVYLVSKITGYNGVDIGFSPYGHYWRQLRKICTLELLSVKRVQSFKAIREEEIASLMKHITEHEGSVINLPKLFFPLANSIVARASIGNSKHVNEVVSIMKNTLELATGLGISDLFPSVKFLPVITGFKGKLEKLFVDSDKILEEVVNEHRQKNESSKKGSDEVQHEDLVDVLLKIQKENDLDIQITDDAIKAIIQDMFFGATETTAAILEWAMCELLRNPETMKEAQAEVRKVFGSKGYVEESELHKCAYIDAAVKETLRLHPPLPLLVPRENSKIIEISGYEIPYKSRVMVNAWALGRDPKYWKEAEKFQPRRFLDPSTDYNFRGMDHEYIPFGSGRRICPGISFGYAVLDLTIANLLFHVDWKLPNGMKPEELDMEETFTNTATRKNNLCVVPTVYRP